jgi:hypothetical protein
MIPEWMMIERRNERARKWQRRRRLRLRLARAFAREAYFEAVAYWSRQVYRGKSHVLADW